MEEPILELHYDSRAAMWALPWLVIFTLIGLYALVTRGSEFSVLVFGSVFTGIGLYGLYFSVLHADDKSVVLRIGPDGILDRRLGEHLIRWEEIIAIEERQTWQRDPIPYLDVVVDQHARVRPGAWSIAWWLGGARGFPVTQNGLDGTFHQVFRAAKYFGGRRGVPFYSSNMPFTPDRN